jgi:hypothetical protein
LVLGIALLGGCDKVKHQSPGAAKAETKRHQTACASPAAYGHLKDAIFDQAIAERPVGRSNLDMLADYSAVRMENPVVAGFDQSLDITRCKGHFILEVPPGAERGLGGARQLEADIQYTAQASADGAGLVYQQRGADEIVAKLAAFNLGAVAYRPAPAIDQDQLETGGQEQAPARQALAPEPSPELAQERPVRPVADRARPARAPAITASSRTPQPAPTGSSARPAAASRLRETEQASAKSTPSPAAPRGASAVRAFYAAVGAGNGTAAASHVVPEKRSSGPFSAGAISRFYGRLPQPLRLTSVTPSGGAYRVTYRYSAGRSHCNGVALVRVTQRGGRDLISSIRSLSGC